MNERNDQTLEIATDRFERRLADECGKLRVEIAEGFGRVGAQFGHLRAEMMERNSELLKWLLLYLVAHITATAALLALFR